jgi:hypothetical protein
MTSSNVLSCVIFYRYVTYRIDQQPMHVLEKSKELYKGYNAEEGKKTYELI